MSEITQFEKYKAGKELGKRIKEVINLDMREFRQDMLPSGEWSIYSSYAFEAFMDCNIAINRYDVALMFRGIAKNELVPINARELARELVDNTTMYLDVKSSVLYYSSGCFVIEHNKDKHGTYNIEGRESSRCLYLQTLEYFKELLESPERITGYDVCALIYGLKEGEAITEKRYNEMQHIVERYYSKTFEEVLLSEALYIDSLMKNHLEFPERYMEHNLKNQ
ncbi:hypothetical protein [Staphylococcus equorum]|uniref:Uncharacterized protein n=1 Tax=Staphylococcus equorum TaxID=246432 RepID=A0AAP7IFF9_9STAP|nr:hypothetical protein [Staphylococcus equorum]OEK58950.1 hypothetical protein ASS94_01085 [Staphylococcus equorum]